MPVEIPKIYYLILSLAAIGLFQILTPTFRWLGILLQKFLQEKLKIKRLSLNLIQGILRNLLLLFVILSSFYLFSKIPKKIVNFGDNVYIKRDEQTGQLTIYTEGIPQASFSKDGLIVYKDLETKGSIYVRDIGIDMTMITPDEVLNILKGAKGITLIREEIAKETAKEVLKSLKTEGVIK
ncbi:MAG: hypothetical protein V1925_04430 [Candidatus Omnitrophota bacterium]